MKKTYLKPLKQFVCDKSGEVIDITKDCYVEYLFHNLNHEIQYGFKIVNNKFSCYEMQLSCSMEINDFLNGNYLNEAINKIEDNLYGDKSKRIISIEEAVEIHQFKKRLTVPYYEEARLYFKYLDEELIAKFDGLPYEPNNLKLIIDEYKFNRVMA